MKKRYTTVFLLVLSLLISGVAATAQAQQEKVDLEAIAKIKEEGDKNSQVMDILSYMTDVYGPRLTGSPQLKEAQEWAKSTLAKWGLENAHLEAWGPFGRGWSLEGFSANVTEPHFTPLIAYPKAWSPSTNGAVRGRVVYLDAKNEADLEKYKGKLKGAIVLIASPREVKAHFDPQGTRRDDANLLKLADADMPAGGDQRRRFQMSDEQRAAFALANKKMMMANEEGAAVVLEPGPGDGGTIFVSAASIPASGETNPFNRPRPWATDAPKFSPQVVVAAEHYNRIVRMIEKGVPVQMEVNISSKYYDKDLMNYNVIAEIPGTDLKDEIVMLGGHYDSWHAGTGATDNGAGSAVAMEAVRIIKSLGLKPRRTIRIALWSGEEQGLLGSRAYVAEHFGKRVDQRGQNAPDTNPQFELTPEWKKLVAYFNLDNGTGKIRGVYMQSNEEVRPIFRAWLAPFKDMGATTLTLANTGGTDHLSFDAVGLPGFQFIQDEIEYGSRTHHSNMDVYDRIQPDDMKQAATIMAAFVYNAAMRDDKLPRKPLPGQPEARSGN